MLITSNNQIHCFICNKDFELGEIFENFLFLGSISCPKNHLLGNKEDLPYCYLTRSCECFYLYHNQGNCRAIQEECNCNGVAEDCDNPTGKECYQADLREDTKCN